MNANRLIIALLSFIGACTLSEPGGPSQPEIRVGSGPELPAVIDLRYTDDCSSLIRFTLRFSQPMERAIVESAVSFSEIIGDMQGEELPLSEGIAAPTPNSFRWEDQDKTLSFTADPPRNRQVVLKLPASVTNKGGRGIDGLVGMDVNGDGAFDIEASAENFARADDDFLAVPSDFLSLPFFTCKFEERGGETSVVYTKEAPSVWRAPLNGSRPRVLEFAGLLPNNEPLPRYLDNGGFQFSVNDFELAVSAPLPSSGILRFAAASPNDSPPREFTQRTASAPVLPSTLIGNFDVIDDSLKDYEAALFLDDRLQIPAPLLGTISSVALNRVEALEFAALPDNALQGMLLVARGANDFVYALPITANRGGVVWVNDVYYEDTQVVRMSFESQTLTFRDAAFRENELKGMTLRNFSGAADLLVAEGNGAEQVRIKSGSGTCAAAVLTFCHYKIFIDLETMGFKGKSFEVVPSYLYVNTGIQRLDGQVFRLRLNVGSGVITDIYGREFVDGLADGDERQGEADNEWSGMFTSGDYSTAPIPPRLQLNDGRYYSPFTNGSVPGAVTTLSPEGTFVHLANGVMGRYQTICPGGSPSSRLHTVGLFFATPDAKTHDIGPDDLLDLASINSENFSLFRYSGLELVPLGSNVHTTTIQHTFHYTELNVPQTVRLSATLVLLAPASAALNVTDAGDDGICGTGDDFPTADIRPWQAGDRVLISHRIRYTGSDSNSLDGNYDGILTSDASDDMVFEYQPNVPGEMFKRVR